MLRNTALHICLGTPLHTGFLKPACHNILHTASTSSSTHPSNVSPVKTKAMVTDHVHFHFSNTAPERGLCWQSAPSDPQKSQHAFRFVVSSGAAQATVTSTVTPLGPLLSSVPSPGGGPFCHHQHCSSHMATFPGTSSAFQPLFQVLTQETQTRANGCLKLHRNQHCSKLMQSSNYFSLNKKHCKADRSQNSPVYSLSLMLPCNFMSQKLMAGTFHLLVSKSD